jgi:hypothetical protein
MESDNQPVTNSDISHFSVWNYLKYIWPIVVGGLGLLSLESFFISFFIIAGIIQYSETDALSWFFGFLAVNIMVAGFVVWLPVWKEPESFKTATLGCGSSLLDLLAAFTIPILIISSIPSRPNNPNLIPHSHTSDWQSAILYLLFSFFVLSSIICVISLLWGLEDDRTGNRLNPRAGEAVKLSRIALVSSFVIEILACCLFALLGASSY